MKKLLLILLILPVLMFSQGKRAKIIARQDKKTAKHKARVDKSIEKIRARQQSSAYRPNGNVSDVKSHDILKLNDVSAIIKQAVEKKINIWQKQGDFEKTIDYQKRVNETTRNQMIEKYQIEALEYQKFKYAELTDFKSFEIKDYDPDNETFLLYSPDLKEIIINVPILKAEYFRDNFSNVKYQKKNFIFSNNEFILTSFEIIDNVGNVYTYNNKNL